MTPAIRMLRHVGVQFSIHDYSCHVTQDFGLHAAEQLQVSPELVYKTLLVRHDQGAAVALVPVCRQLSLKNLARALGLKKVEMMLPAEAEKLTGYKVGGISPFAQKHILPTVLDSQALQQERILVSGGKRGLSIGIQPDDLLALLDGKTALIGE